MIFVFDGFKLIGLIIAASLIVFALLVVVYGELRARYRIWRNKG